MKREGNINTNRAGKVTVDHSKRGIKRARIVIRSRQFPIEFEEAKGKVFLVTLGRSAAFNAINENKALGIATTYLHGNKVVAKQADGTELIVRELPTTAQRKFTKGTVLHARKAIRS
ncbi:MAG: hypothetical protein ACTHMC_09295 [Pseudobacter sp.]|uniref:hypothetical protein n=1 Tax=Pseudobacter sp. TaxID=2045420 RepID=UPI003F7F4ABC